VRVAPVGGEVVVTVGVRNMTLVGVTLNAIPTGGSSRPDRGASAQGDRSCGVVAEGRCVVVAPRRTAEVVSGGRAI